MKRTPTIVGLIAAIAGPPLLVLLGRGASFTTKVLLEVAYWAIAAFVLWMVPLKSIGLRRPTWMTWLSAAVLWIFCWFVLPRGTTPEMQSALHELAALPLWFRVVAGATGGIIEEILYRGYTIERLIWLTHRQWLAATVSVVAFTLAHIPAWGAGYSLAADLPFGIVMTLFYLWRRDLVANIVAHSALLVAAMITI